MEQQKRKMNKRNFVLNAIHTLRKPGYLGIHAVYSGLNGAFRDYYNEDPITEIDKLVEGGVIIKMPVKGGVMLYDYVEYKKAGKTVRKNGGRDTNEVLKKILKA